MMPEFFLGNRNEHRCDRGEKSKKTFVLVIRIKSRVAFIRGTQRGFLALLSDRIRNFYDVRHRVETIRA